MYVWVGVHLGVHLGVRLGMSMGVYLGVRMGVCVGGWVWLQAPIQQHQELSRIAKLPTPTRLMAQNMNSFKTTFANNATINTMFVAIGLTMEMRT